MDPSQLFQIKVTFKMASSERTPQYRKEENLILIVCLQELIMEQTRFRRNILEQYIIMMEEVTNNTTMKKSFVRSLQNYLIINHFDDG